MDIRIVPEPTPEERAAILAALRRLQSEQGGEDPGPWWRLGAQEGTCSFEDEGYGAAALPRSTPGAARA
ncbi:MAG: hypothetical protein C4306_00905 [Thermoleophilia bacterium]